MIAARARELFADDLPAQPAGFLLGPLVWFSVSFPVLHFSLPDLGFGTAELAPIRAVLTLILQIVIAAMADSLRLED